MMYQEHFKMKTQPFSEHASSSSLWIDQRMKDGVARLTYLAESAELGLVTGQTGVGKSALLRYFLSHLPQQCEAVYCHLANLPPAGMLKMLVSKLGEVPRRGKDRLFEQISEAAQRIEGELMLVIDEAHLLDSDALTDLRLLLSSALDAAPPMKILLVGQPPLRAVLKRSRHADLLNRINVHYQLRAFTKDQTSRYIDIQMKQSGAAEDIFDGSVKDLIHDFTGGVPRQINNLATACLMHASASELMRIDDAQFRAAAADFQLA